MALRFIKQRTYDVEKIQKRACRIILGRQYSTYNDALDLCKLETLSGRREDHCRRFAEGLSETNRTSDLIPPTRGECHGRVLRNSSKISQLRARTDRFRKSGSFFY